MRKELRAQLEALPEWSSDPVQRLRHTLAAHAEAQDGTYALTATSGARAVLGESWTGVTWGDLRALLVQLDGEKGASVRGTYQKIWDLLKDSGLDAMVNGEEFLLQDLVDQLYAIVVDATEKEYERGYDDAYKVYG
jgi:hypothetical protein